MTRYLASFLLLAACGPQQTRPAPDQTSEPTPVDAAAEPVVVASPDAGGPPVVPPLEGGSADELRARLKAATTDDERIIYLGQLAELAWAGLCAAPTDGLCFTMVPRSKKAPPTCDQHEADVKVTARPFAGVKDVTALVGEVRQLWGGGSAIHEITDPSAQADAYVANFHMTQEYGAALLIQADQAFEAFLALKPLTGLDFDPDHGSMGKKSLKRFDAYVQDLVSLGAEALALYQGVLDEAALSTYAPAALVTGYARIGQLQQRFADNLYGLEIPTDIRKDAELVTVFCDTLAEKAAPVAEQARASKDACKMVAEALGQPGDRCSP